ncbi:antirestriction protein ArdA [Acidimicrobiales bacterium]|nr:antirestriction protein ArdA [Acidimicrobiales bacterium]
MEAHKPERNEQQPTEHTPERGQEGEPAVQPKIYAACLAAYNSGYLHGDWIHADQEAEYLHAEIQDMLERSPIRGAEEWAIHDYEGFGAFNLHEYENLETVARVAGGIALHGLAFSHWIHEVGSDAEDAVETFDDHYVGRWDSVGEYAEQLVEDMGHDPIREEAEWMRPFIRIDYQTMGAAITSGMATAQDQDGVHIFHTR